MKILVLNCGSSSVKFRLFQMEEEELLAGGLVERIGSGEAALVYRVPGKEASRSAVEARDHEQAIDLVLRTLCHPDYGVLDDIHRIDAIGHRVVHGGETFTQPVLINEAVLRKIKECMRFAPLHNPPNVSGIEASLFLIPFARQIAVFDTAFHQTMKPEAYIYALPYEWYQARRIRRYGFHGTSHRYVSQRASQTLGRPIEQLRIITCHLGNGASMSAVDGGRSVDTSMGFTPVEGLVMGTRCGDIDSSVPLHVMEEDGLTPPEIDSVLNKKSGLIGITGGDNDLRAIEEKAASGSERHTLALKIFTRRVKKYIGAYAAIMGGLDCIVFTAGIGENSSTVRSMVCEGMEFLGVEIDPAGNEQNAMTISRGRVAVLVIPTDEELAIAEEVKAVLAEEATIEEASVATGTGTSAKKILTIDDDPDFQSALKTILEKADYEVLQANSMRQGIEMLSNTRPDLILLDVMMEDISAGFRFAKELKNAEREREQRHVPILMVTSVQKVTSLNFEDRVGTDSLPVDGFLEKPIEPQVLIERIREALAEGPSGPGP
jgi:acetate kinase